MNSLKEATIESIKRLPEKCSLEDIMYQIDFIAQVLEGMEEAHARRSISTDELLENTEQWQ